MNLNCSSQKIASHFLKYDVIYFVRTKSPWFYCYRHFFPLCVTFNKALPVTIQSFTLFLYKMKHAEAERYDLILKNLSGFGAKMWEQSVLVQSQLITTAQKVVAKTDG